MIRTRKQSSTCGTLAALLGCVLLAGCGGSDGVDRYDLTGRVEFAGAAVPAGEIHLSPDTSKGNSGPGSFAMIHEGRYETTPGQGIVGGAYQVRIIGYDAPPSGEGESGGGSPLFPTYEGQFELPATGGEFNFEVPASTP